MLIKSGKDVQNCVNKYAQKSWNLIVQKCLNVENLLQNWSFAQAKINFKQVFAIFNHNLRTVYLAISSLLNEGFTPFAHRTINTTITFNNKERINF